MSVILGDCIEEMAKMEAESVDAIVTDPLPPYGLEFMGKEWDRLGDIGKTSKAKPTTSSGSLDPSYRAAFGRLGGVSFSGSSNRKCRTCGKWQWDHVGRKCECERPDFPNIARHQGLLMGEWHQRWAEAAYRVAKPSAYLLAFGGTRTVHRMTVALEDAGWIIRDMLVWAYASGFPKSKASLKPAWEPIVMARKPGPLRMLAIDECRIGYTSDADAENASVSTVRTEAGVNKILGKGLVKAGPVEFDAAATGGRWPANVILTDPIFDGGVEGVVGGGETSVNVASTRGTDEGNTMYGGGAGLSRAVVGQRIGLGDSGTYSRFFLIPKADRGDREPIIREPDTTRGDDGARPQGDVRRLAEVGENAGQRPQHLRRANSHPTVKPTELMRHLVRLVTPAGGTVLDPFGGSGTTAIACELEGFPWILVEKESEYVAIAEARLNGTQRGLGLAG